MLAFGLFLVSFVLTALLLSIPALTHDTLHEIYERTIAYQENRGSPFSVWGLYGHSSTLSAAQGAVEGGAVLLALLLAVVPRRPGTPPLAAAAAAILIALQLGIEHWFCLYIPWFFALVMIALLARDPVSARSLRARRRSRPRHQDLLDRVRSQWPRTTDHDPVQPRVVV